MPNNDMNFEDAAAAAEQLFAEEPQVGDAGGEAPEDMVVEEPQAEPAAEPQAEPQAEPPVQPQPNWAQMQAQMNALMEQNAQLQGIVNELNNKNKEQIVEKTIEMPTLDFGSLAFADEEEARAAQIKYAQDMQEYVRAGLMHDLQPLLDEAKRGERVRDEEAAIEGLRAIQDVDDLDDLLPEMRGLIERNPILSRDDLSMPDKMVLAYGLARGVRSMSAPKELSVDQMMEMYNNNADFRAAIEKRRMDAAKDGMQVPPLSASSGAANAALQLKNKPANFDDADELTRAMFR